MTHLKELHIFVAAEIWNFSKNVDIEYVCKSELPHHKLKDIGVDSKGVYYLYSKDSDKCWLLDEVYNNCRDVRQVQSEVVERYLKSTIRNNKLDNLIDG